MPQTGEFYRHRVSNFEVRRGRPSEDTLEERLRFVKRMRWFPEEFRDDTDRYDMREDTYHFTRRDENGSIITAMRLTPVEDIKTSLSYEMMGANLGLQAAAARSQEVLKDSALWDLTRLVFPRDGSHGSEEIEDAMIEMFGMAARVSAGEIDGPRHDVNWVFTTTPWILRFFQKTGIQSTVLALGKLPDIDGRGKTTYFCQVNVASAIEALSEQHIHTLARLKKGANEAEKGLMYA